MSAAVAMLPRLRAVGADAELRGGRVILTHASVVSPDLLAELRTRRADLLAELAGSNKPFVDDPEERAAIQAEAVRTTQLNTTNSAPSHEVMNDTAPEADALQRRHLTPYSGNAKPTQGAWCGCCQSSRWWTETQDPKGWRCQMCHPPAHLKAEQFQIVRT